VSDGDDLLVSCTAKIEHEPKPVVDLMLRNAERIPQ